MSKYKTGFALKISYELLLELLKGKFDLPEDAILCDVRYDSSNDTMYVKFKKQDSTECEFPWCLIPEGGEYPYRRLEHKEKE